MHFSIFVYGTWGDIRPHVVLGMGLQKAGHEVQVVASRGYEQWVRERGLDYYPLTTDMNTFSKENAAMLDESFIKQLQIVRTSIQPIFAQMGLEVLEATRNSDILMTVEFAIPLLFDVLKVNNLKPLLLNPAHLNPTREFASAATPAPEWFPFKGWYNLMSYRLLRRAQWSLTGGARKEIAKTLEVPRSTIKEYNALMDTSPALTIVSPHVLHRPSDWGEQWQVTGYLFDEDADWTPPQDLLDFLTDGEAPVYIGFGSMPDSKPDVTTQLIIEAVQKAGKRAIILTGWAGLGADDVPQNIHILKYAPHTWLFPKVAAVIHHGGAGTTAAGFRAGVPMTVIPHTADQPFWGKRVHDLSVGTKPIPRKKLSADNLANAIQEATSDKTMQQNARVLSEKIQQEDGLAEAIKWIEHYLL